MPTSKTRSRDYTVIGFYPDTNQRFFETVKAVSVAHAQEEAMIGPGRHGLLICGVFKGTAESASSDTVGKKDASFTVVGFYPDTRQRFCESAEAKSGSQAGKLVCGERHRDGLVVAGVILGDIAPADIRYPLVTEA